MIGIMDQPVLVGVGIVVFVCIFFLIRECRISGAWQHKHHKVKEAFEQSQRECVQLQAQYDSQKVLLKDREQSLQQLHEQMEVHFKALSMDRLKQTQEQFLQLANQAFQGEREKSQQMLHERQQAMEVVVEPLKDSLQNMQQIIRQIEKERSGAYLGLKTQVEQMGLMGKNLTEQTRQLAQALRSPAGKGQWGELQLKRVVEMAGMVEHCDFEQQVQMEGNAGKLRPDLVVHLPGGQHIIVDAKATMEAYLDAQQTDDLEVKKEALKRHVQQIKTQIKGLAQKKYDRYLAGSPELVVLFLPSESFFSSALSVEPGLIEVGVDQGVILATPTTLIALLKVVAHGWRQESLASNAREISKVGSDLYQRMMTLITHLEKVGKGIEMSVTSYNQAVGSMESRLLVSAKRLHQLGSSSGQVPQERMNRVEESLRNRHRD